MLLSLACVGSATIELADTAIDSAGPGGSGDSAAEEPARLRLALLGDAGEQQIEIDGEVIQESWQAAVAGALSQVCAAQGCDAVLYLGDNFYPAGLDTVDDPRWDEQFSDMYDLDAPFWVVLGNHDHGESIDRKGGYPQQILDPAKAQVQLGYAGDARWTLPATAWSTLHEADVELFFFDSTPEVYAVDEEAQLGEHAANRALAEDLAASGAGLRIAVAHHPYVSNGRHGDAGSYDGEEGACEPEAWVHPDEPRAGTCWKAFVEQRICGEVDLFVAGHDHSLQVLDGPEGCFDTAIVSGSASKIHDPERTPLGDDNPARFQEATHGFVWLGLCEGAVEELIVYDDEGQELYRESGACG